MFLHPFIKLFIWIGSKIPRQSPLASNPPLIEPGLSSEAASLADAALPAFSGFGENREWEASQAFERSRSERRAWLIARASLAATGLALVALASLAPLKSAVPFLVYVDRPTGGAEVIEVTRNRPADLQEIEDKHWATQYVRSRERYQSGLLQYDYDTVVALSDANVARSYAHLYEGADALDRRLGVQGQIEIEVLSVTLPPGEPGRAVVRFERTTRRNFADSAGTVERFVATLAYSYRAPLFARERDVVENPLGFRVTAYTVDSELPDRSARGQS